MILYEKAHKELARFGFYSCDTETTPFNPTQYGYNHKTRIAPFGGHQLIVGSICGGGRVLVLDRPSLLEHLLHLLSTNVHLLFHNCAFDIPLLCRTFPDLESLFQKAVEEDRIHDTQILEVLIAIARGSRTVSEKGALLFPSLEELASRRAGMKLNKNLELRLGFAPYLDCPDTLPKGMLHYAAEDAVATYRVYFSQVREAETMVDQPDCRFPVWPDARQRFGLLTEKIQIMGALAFEWLERFPVRVDLKAAAERRDQLLAEQTKLEDVLIGYQWARRTPKKQKFCFSNLAIRKLLKEYAAHHQIVPEYTPTGLIALKYDFWAEYIPALDGPPPEANSNFQRRLSVWLRYLRVQRLLSRYIYPYASAERHYPIYRNLAARTGRASATTPPIQQVPLRRDGIRNLFIPEENHVFIEADFQSAELVALAEVYRALYGGSNLGSALNTGLDPHLETAQRIVSDYDTFDPLRKKYFRFLAKAINFGLPGGLGVKKFAKYAKTRFGINVTEEEARAFRERAFSAEPALRDYLSEKHSAAGLIRIAAHNLHLTEHQLIGHLRAWQVEDEGQYNLPLAYRRLKAWIRGKLQWKIPTPPGFDIRYDLFKSMTRTLTGRLRGNAAYAAAHNTPFQGIISDTIKIALWNLYVNWTAQPQLFQPVTAIHDSILIQTQQPFEAKIVLENSMLRAFRQTCPSIRGGVEISEPKSAWGQNLT